MHWQGFRIVLGLLIAFGGTVGIVLGLRHTIDSCRPDHAVDHAPFEAGSATVGPVQLPFFGCDVTYGLLEGGSLVEPALFAWAWVFLVVAALGVGTIVWSARR